MVEIGIDVMCNPYIVTTRFWDVIGNVLYDFAINGMCPIMLYVRYVRIVWLIDPYPNGTLSHLGEVAANAANACEVALTRSGSEGGHGHDC